MESEVWLRIQELFHEAIELPPAERSAFLTHACGEDHHLRSELETYLAAYEAKPELIENPVFSLGLRTLWQSESRPSLEGTEIGQFRILQQLGEGGMGEVYLAEDIKLDRKVALKFLSQRLVNDSWAKRQLKREAQAVAKLDHPNICTVHGFEEQDGHSFIVMPFVEGETLFILLQKQAFPKERTTQIAIQIASALAEAHAHGIIHRDVKPKNIIVSAQDQVKVLDFGLAKSVAQNVLNPNALESRGSSLELVVGTVRYMSPEQLKNEKLDSRTDIFSFGIVLYEMITGQNPFAKETDAESITAILMMDLPDETDGPQGLLEIARKCLSKDRERRYQSVNEILLDLEDELRGKTKLRQRPRSGRLRMQVALATLLLLIIATAICYSALTRVRTLAVLPVLNLSGDQSVDYLGDGLTDTLIQRLSRLSRLKVRPRTLVAGHRDASRDLAAIGRALDVELVFASEITKRGEQSVLETRLFRTKDGATLWNESRNLNPAELLSFHAGLCNTIAEKSLFFMRDSERSRLLGQQTRSPEAFSHYLQARSYWNNRTKENIPLAIKLYQKAYELDREFFEAYAGLANCYAIRTTVAYGSLPTEEAMPLAKDYAMRALEGDSTSSEAHTSLGIVELRFDWDIPEAEKEFKLAISLNPDNSQAHFWYSHLLALTGRMEDSIAAGAKAFELDPTSGQAEMNLGRCFFWDRQYDRARVHFEKMLEKNPSDENAIYMIGLILLKQGAYDKVIEMYLPMHAVDKTNVAGPLGFAYAKSGRPEQARKILAELDALSPKKKDGSLMQEKAIILIALKEMDRAVDLLLEVCKDRFASFLFFGLEPLFDDLRSHSRYAELLRCIRPAE